MDAFYIRLQEEVEKVPAHDVLLGILMLRWEIITPAGRKSWASKAVVTRMTMGSISVTSAWKWSYDWRKHIRSQNY